MDKAENAKKLYDEQQERINTESKVLLQSNDKSNPQGDNDLYKNTDNTNKNNVKNINNLNNKKQVNSKLNKNNK